MTALAQPDPVVLACLARQVGDADDHASPAQVGTLEGEQAALGRRDVQPGEPAWIAVSDVQPGSAHDLAAARGTGFVGTLHAVAALLGLTTLADKGYAGAGIGVHTPAKGGRLAPSTACRNQLLTRLRALIGTGEQR